LLGASLFSLFTISVLSKWQEKWPFLCWALLWQQNQYNDILSVTPKNIVNGLTAGSMTKLDSIEPERRRHYFFLNPYEDAVFTKCPRCHNETKIRKFPLVIHIDPQQLLLLNKKCRYCDKCDLIIAKKSEL